LSDARKEAGRSGSEIALIVSETVFIAILVLVMWYGSFENGKYAAE
jgi:hypothetical protein